MHAAEDSESSDNFGFCQWYRTSNFTPIGFSINSFGVKLISQLLRDQFHIKLVNENPVGVEFEVLYH